MILLKISLFLHKNHQKYIFDDDKNVKKRDLCAYTRVVSMDCKVWLSLGSHCGRLDPATQITHQME